MTETIETIILNVFPNDKFETNASFVINQIPLNFDFYCASLRLAINYRILCYEFIQSYHGTIEAFQRQEKMMDERRVLCAKLKITLVEVSLLLDYEEVDQLSRNRLNDV